MPELKRFNVGRFILSFNNELAVLKNNICICNSRNEFYYNCNKQNLLINVGGKPCGGEVSEQKEQLEILLKVTFQLQEGFEISVENVLSCPVLSGF